MTTQTREPRTYTHRLLLSRLIIPDEYRSPKIVMCAEVVPYCTIRVWNWPW